MFGAELEDALDGIGGQDGEDLLQIQLRVEPEQPAKRNEVLERRVHGAREAHVHRRPRRERTKCTAPAAAAVSPQPTG